ncbi:hypothetical protein LINGRAHAP2_LOCUS5315 [Linum grandiflorum]
MFEQNVPSLDPPKIPKKGKRKKKTSSASASSTLSPPKGSSSSTSSSSLTKPFRCSKKKAMYRELDNNGQTLATFERRLKTFVLIFVVHRFLARCSLFLLGFEPCSHGRLKLCLLITTILILILAVVAVIIFFTVLKPKQPTITTKSITLDRIESSLQPKPFLNFTLGIIVEVKNPNYGSFRYSGTTAYLVYRGNLVGVSPVPAGYSKPRSTEEIRTNVTLMAGEFLTDLAFVGDLIGGVLNFTSTSSVHGKAEMFKVLKAEITSNSTCEITVHVLSQKMDSTCKTVVIR